MIFLSVQLFAHPKSEDKDKAFCIAQHFNPFERAPMKAMKMSQRLRFQVYVEDDVVLEHIFPESILYPGTRLSGKNTVIAPGEPVPEI